MNGTDLIAAAYRRRIANGNSPEQDDQHTDGQLARAARCLVNATVSIRSALSWAYDGGPRFADTYPNASQREQIRADLEQVKVDPLGYHYGRDDDGTLKPPGALDGEWPWAEPWAPSNTPIDNLTEAGALLAAEIDRLLRAGDEIPEALSPLAPPPDATGDPLTSVMVALIDLTDDQALRVLDAARARVENLQPDLLGPEASDA